MSQENVEVVREVFAAFNEVGMAEAALRFFDTDAVFAEPPEQPGPTVAEGRDRAIRVFAQFEEAWEEHRSETEELYAIDDERVLALSVEHFRGRGGIEISQPCGHIFTLRGGQVVRLQSFWERANALEAAGLSE